LSNRSREISPEKSPFFQDARSSFSRNPVPLPPLFEQMEIISLIQGNCRPSHTRIPPADFAFRCPEGQRLLH
jgi:hypothetical protein